MAAAAAPGESVPGPSLRLRAFAEPSVVDLIWIILLVGLLMQLGTIFASGRSCRVRDKHDSCTSPFGHKPLFHQSRFQR